MKKWKLASGILAAIAFALVIALFWQNQQIKRDLLHDYALEHASLELALNNAIQEFEESGDARVLSANLAAAYGQSQVILKTPRITQLNGKSFTENIPYFYEMGSEFDFYLMKTVSDTMTDAEDGNIDADRLDLLLSYQGLLQDFNKTMLTEGADEKSFSELKSDLEEFYTARFEEIQEGLSQH